MNHHGIMACTVWSIEIQEAVVLAPAVPRALVALTEGLNHPGSVAEHLKGALMPKKQNCPRRRR